MRSYPFVDWMKAIGISLIVYGHVAHATTERLTPPIYVKQLGVALFLFATAFTLARERRSAAQVLVARLFPVYLFGLSCAVLLTIVGPLTHHGFAPSNYLPLAGGVNVFFNNFPANPTTWYLGTYLHFLLVWAIWFRRIRVQRWMIAAAVLVEVPMRAALIAAGRPFIAYMLLTNWTVVFLFGMLRGAEWEPDSRPEVPVKTDAGRGLAYAGVLVGGLAAWGAVMGALPFQTTFPFLTFEGEAPLWAALGASLAVTLLYAVTAGLVFEMTRGASAPAPVKFIARNTLIIFLGHMPLFYAINPLLAAAGLDYWSIVAVRLAACLGGVGLLSEAIIRVVRPHELREAFAAALSNSSTFARLGWYSRRRT